jgi:hypothetical protein
MTGDYYHCKECDLAYREEDCDASYEFADKGVVQFLQHYCPNDYTPLALIDPNDIDPSIFDYQGARP